MTDHTFQASPDLVMLAIPPGCATPSEVRRHEVERRGRLGHRVVTDETASAKKKPLLLRIWLAVFSAINSLAMIWQGIDKARSTIQGLCKMVVSLNEELDVQFGMLHVTAANVKEAVTGLKWFGIAGLFFDLKDAVLTMIDFVQTCRYDEAKDVIAGLLPVTLTIGGLTASVISAIDFVVEQVSGKGLEWATPVLVPLGIGLSALGVVSNGIGAKRAHDLMDRLKDIPVDSDQVAALLLKEVQVSEDEIVAKLAERGIARDSKKGRIVEARLKAAKRAAFSSAASSKTLKRVEALAKITDADRLNAEAKKVAERVKVVAKRRFASRITGAVIKAASIVGLVCLVVPPVAIAGGVILATVGVASFAKYIYDKFFIDKGEEELDTGVRDAMDVTDPGEDIDFD